MTTNTTPKEKAAGGLHTTTATTTNDLDFVTPDHLEQTFARLRAEFAQRGHALHRSHPTDGPVAYWVERWGLVRYLPTLHDTGLFLAKIGGRL